MADYDFDVLVIGSGPGGYIAAIRAAQLGFNVACVDEWKNDKGGPAPGGTCTNVGCIPSKALLQSSENFEHAGHQFAEHGIVVEKLSIDVARMLARKKTVVKQNNDGILYLFKKNKVSFFHGRGSFAGRGDGGLWQVAVAGAKAETLSAKHVIVATGSNARALPGAPFDEKNILSNDGALAVGTVPKTLGIVGSGVIGLEMGSVWRRLGAEVTVLEALPRIMPKDDPELVALLADRLRADGVRLRTGVQIHRVEGDGDGVALTIAAESGEERLAGSHLLVAAGRRPNLKGLDLAKAGIALNERGGLVVDRRLRTSNRRVYAVGDAAGGPQFTHIAGYHAGIVIRNALFRLPAKVDYRALPWVTYTEPELAQVGLTEAEARERHPDDLTILRWPFHENDRAQAERSTHGVVKVVTRRNGRVLGASILGAQAGELIQPWALAIGRGLKVGAIATMIAPYPTLGEVSKRAAGSFFAPKLFSERTRRLVRLLGRLG